MINLSIFAKNNPVKARFIIVLAHIMLPILAIYFGGFLYDVDWVLPTVLIPILIVIFFFAYYFYPNKKRPNNFFKHTYWRQKSLDFTFVMISFFLISTSVNDLLINSPENHISAAKPTFIVMKSHNAPAKEHIFTKSFKKIKEVRKNIRKEIRAWKKQQTPKDKGLIAKQFFLIILTLLIAVGLGILILVLGCDLSCSGHETLAAVVYVGGFTGILVGVFFAIRAIIRMGNKPETI